jgi:PIN domain nuclease of toxin-antitoxin system
VNLLLDTHVALWAIAEHALAVEALPAHHRDPFDRILIAQALVEPLRLMTHDAIVARYSDTVIAV